MSGPASAATHPATSRNGTSGAPATRGSPGPDARSVPDLVRDLLRAVSGMIRGTAHMAALEAREIVPRFGRRVALLVGSAIVAGAGILLALGGAALLVESALQLPRWAAVLGVGLLALCAGAAGIAAALRRLGAADLAFPETLAEISKDADALSSHGADR